jgi:hypothetical protein
MYALFFEDTGELIATVDRAPHAMGLGRLVSREKCRVVIGVLNNGDGSTELCWRFMYGRQVSALSSADESNPLTPPSFAPSGDKKPSY